MTKRRFDHATDMRALASDIRKSRFRDSGAYLEQMDAFAKRLSVIANEVARGDDNPVADVFGIRPGVKTAATGRVFTVEKRAARSRARVPISGLTTPAAPLEKASGWTLADLVFTRRTA